MVTDAGSFFSTLTQFIATAIGFIIAIITAVYVSKRSRARSRDNQVLFELNSIRREYYPPLSAIIDILEENLQNLQALEEIGIEDYDIDGSELSSLARNHNSESIAVIWAHVNRIISIFQNYPASTRGERELQLERVQESSETLQENFSRESQLPEHIFEVVSLRDESNKREFPLFGQRPAIDQWLNQKGLTVDEASLEAWEYIFSNLNKGLNNCARLAKPGLRPDLDTESNILKRCVWIFIAGAVVPFWFLLSWPVNTPVIPPFWLILIELFISVFILCHFYLLYFDIQDLIGSEII